MHADGLDLAARNHLDREFAAKIRASGLRLDVWTVNDPDVAKRMIEFGAQGIKQPTGPQLDARAVGAIGACPQRCCAYTLSALRMLV